MGHNQTFLGNTWRGPTSLITLRILAGIWASLVTSSYYDCGGYDKQRFPSESVAALPRIPQATLRPETARRRFEGYIETASLYLKTWASVVADRHRPFHRVLEDADRTAL
jgi:hypothetical protein